MHSKYAFAIKGVRMNLAETNIKQPESNKVPGIDVKTCKQWVSTLHLGLNNLFC